ncbi:hypothetical protein CMQ_5001 [Grosmannia clavigera kw1407]|uniref:Uncharacterized protein n=1 Tax=Grosmannia clavigera (strain kw1407 / UAMH 11150) TaxID=655863 RepID=F0XJY5_GROCL|nr:uncharacterized protein CMQ_5001 [Grosmannia clavigera kw1407]EFX01930.1 hypothetical protein CMQ_5001 [Grosmannia clavigera kw1407]
MQHTQTADKAHRRYAVSSGAVSALCIAQQDGRTTDIAERSIVPGSLSRPQSRSIRPQTPAEHTCNGWDSWWEAGTLNGTKGYPSMAREGIMPPMVRRGSESSVSSATSSSTPPTDRAYSWSTSTTPGSASPTSPPHDELLVKLLQPERTSSLTAFDAHAVTSPTKASQAPVSCRVSRSSHILSRSISTRFHNTPIKSPVPEEEEHSGRHYVQPSQETKPETGCAPSLFCAASQIVSMESPLHQRRQQRQQRLATYSPFPQPQKAKLSPLPPLPIQECLSQQPQIVSPSSTTPRRSLNKEATRSLPQLRDLAAPLPDSLPPLPLVPNLSPMFPASPANLAASSPAVSTGPTTGTVKAPPPHPTMPPPPPPLRTERVPAKDVTREGIHSSSRDSKYTSQQPQQPLPDRWEEERRRHKQLLRHFPQQPEKQGERLKMSRTHKSLGNLRARSRAHSTPSACDTVVTTSSGIIYASSTGRNEPRASKHSKSKSLWENTGRLDEPLPPTPQPDAPHVSIFEDDSDDEGDTVRQFVRNLFTRRTRSSEIPTLGYGTHESIANPHAGFKDSATTKAIDYNNHNTWKKNHSTSSSYSTAAAAAANLASLSAITAASSGGDIGSGLDVEYQPDSPRTSSDHTRQRGPLLTRMFVRRSH